MFGIFQKRKSLAGSAKKDIFSQYDDTGSKTNGRHTPQKPLPNIQAPKANQSTGQLNGHKEDSDVETVKEIDPIEEDTNNNIQKKNKRVSLSEDTLREADEELSFDIEQKVFDLTRIQTKEYEALENFRNLTVSPVLTPTVERPLTREQTRMSLDDRVCKVLRGQVHRACPDGDRTIRMFFCSGFKGNVHFV